MFSRNTLKYTAAAAMVVDHAGMFFFPVDTPAGFIMRLLGRLTAPVMCLFIAEGYAHTSSEFRYASRLFIFGIISQFAYAFAHGLSILTADFNMILTLFLSFVILVLYDKVENDVVKFSSIAVCIALSYFCDWGIVAPLWVLGFYIFRDKKEKQTTMFCIVSVVHILSCILSAAGSGQCWYLQLWQTGLFLFVPLFYCYNGRNSGKTAFSKWFFYLFYPLHLVALEILKRCLVS